ncbi:hypothetical protein OIU77_028816 [Salix suchowensis]|uniref:Uncharacterized protein n=1 Tax=Salix suchowensis TaxID=1278906 RepID=A0ABQ9BLB1_9ROSI|nr:hypothetical protein OIU77_028816 [Salix suchowensis]
MDNKNWLWRKRSSEKTIVATNKFGISVKGIDEETQNTPIENGSGPVRRKQRITAGQEKTEAEVDCVKKELDGALKQGIASNEELSHSDAALKKCMQQLNSVPRRTGAEDTRCCHGGNN